MLHRTTFNEGAERELDTAQDLGLGFGCMRVTGKPYSNFGFSFFLWKQLFFSGLKSYCNQHLELVLLPSTRIMESPETFNVFRL